MHVHQPNRGKRLAWSIALNIIITLGQVVAGMISGSLALLSDALHNFTDVVALVISYVANRLMRRKHTPLHTFGYRRSEIVAAFVNAFILTIISIFLIKEAIDRFQHTEAILAGWVMGASALGIVANGLTVLLLHSGIEKNLNQESAYLHMFSDMLTSVAVFFGGLGIYYFQWYWLDPLLTLIIALYLLVASWKVVVRSLRILMQFTPEGIDPEKVNAFVISVESIKNMHHLHLWQLNETDIYMEAHIEFKEDLPLSKANQQMRKLQVALKEKFGINHVTIQPEYQSVDIKELIVQPEDHRPL